MLGSWSVSVFFASADCEVSHLYRLRPIVLTSAVVMILRVWALYGRSKIILGALLIFYGIEVIVNLGYCIWISVRDGRLCT